jgi:hypothetical protein
MAKHYFGEGTATLVVVGHGPDGQGPRQIMRKFRVSGQADVAQHFPLRPDGTPVVGPMVYREMSRREMERSRLPVSLWTDPLARLVWLGGPKPAAVGAA